MLLSVFVALALAQSTPEARALAHAQELTDQVGPRLAGSPGDAKAVAWGVRKLEALGFANVRAERMKVPHWERGSESAELIAPTRQPLVVTALGGSRSTPARGVEAEVLMVADRDALGALPASAVKGKIVFFNQKMRRDPSGAGYGETVGIRSRGMQEAAAKGAVAVVIRSVGTSSARFAHTGTVRREEGKREIPAAALAIPDAELVERLISGGAPVRLRLSLKTWWHPDATSANVIGEIPGKGPLAEGIIVLGAHLDSWDLGTGAVDNAAGVGAVIAAAQAIAASEADVARRTVRVVLFANEENGGKGGDDYAARHADERDRHHAAIVCDSGAGSPRGLAFFSEASAATLLSPVTGGLKLPAPALLPISHPDVQGLRELGVPLVAIRQDTSRYFDLHHTADDTFDKIDPAEYGRFVNALVALTRHLVTQPEPLPRIPEDQRKEKEE